MSATSLSLDKFLPYRLSIAANLVSAAIAGIYQQLFQLSIPEWRLIAVLAEGDGLTQQHIGRRTRMDKVTVSRAAIALHQKGLITRNANPSDARSWVLALTTSGRDLYAKVAPKALELEGALTATFKKEEVEQLHHLLQRLEDVIVGEDGARGLSASGNGDAVGKAGRLRKVETRSTGLGRDVGRPR